MRTVVIGGGAAGIAAARTLHDDGHDVLLVEASDRLGGRAHSLSLKSLFPREGGAQNAPPPSWGTMSTPVAAGYTPPSATHGPTSLRLLASP
ncbi:FAD-dependent oxidoreductase [Sphingomonas sp. LR55]|uniref:FAD-dependent oxidoreductase n=1 Tax=Sphingomonas sp. LR55 TaxID=3050231 RepID=UPI002FE33A11